LELEQQPFEQQQQFELVVDELQVSFPHEISNMLNKQHI
jgi:hypothetical protein